MKKILFFPQNETHVLNFLPIAEQLKNHNISIFYLDTSYIYHQNIFIEDIKGSIFFLPDLSLPISFYKLSNIERLKAVNYLKETLIQICREFDGFVFGSDGALQRVVINQANRSRKPTFLVLDAMISDYNFSLIDILKYSRNKFQDLRRFATEQLSTTISKIFRYCSLNEYLPSTIGMSNVQRIYCIGPHSQQVIQKNQRKDIVVSSGLPRYSLLYKKRDSWTVPLNHKVCYFTGSFKWHGQFDNDIAQRKDLQLLVKTIEKYRISHNLDIELHIKIHPRENIDDYYEFREKDWVYLRNDITVEKCFQEMGLLLSMISTCIVEGLLFNRTVYSILINAPSWKFRKSFLFEDGIKKIKTTKQLNQVIENFLVKEKEKKEVIPINRFFSETTPESAEIISDDILRLIK